jgi:hypothetical protein
MKDHDDVTEILSALEEPRAPERLREATLSRALAAWSSVGPAPAPPVDPWRRVWESRRLRVAWGVTVLVLVLVAIVPLPASRIETPSHGSAPAGKPAPELTAELDLPYLDLGAVPVAGEGSGTVERGRHAAVPVPSANGGER